MGNDSADFPSSSRQAAAAANAAGVHLLDGMGCVVAALPGSSGFAAIPLADCPHLGNVTRPPADGVDARQPCATCADATENWLCLMCYGVFCSRYVNGHGVAHFQSDAHPMVLSFSDLSAWCYECEAYVHNDALLPAKRAAYVSKFGELPAAAVSLPPDETQGWED